MVNIVENLNINTVIADKEPVLYSDCRVSGHPALLPMILAPGHFSEEQKVRLIVDTKECTGKETGKNKAYCLFLGGIPVMRLYDAQIISSLIMPGSSGSAVFNKQGEIAGLVFAGNSGLSYANIVPWKFVKDFTDNQEKLPWVVPDPDAEPKKFMKMLFKTMALCEKRIKINGLCHSPDLPLIWRNKRE